MGRVLDRNQEWPFFDGATAKPRRSTDDPWLVLSVVWLVVLWWSFQIAIMTLIIGSNGAYHWAPSFLIRARRGKEEFGQANFDADVLPEPACRLEIMKHVTGYGKILSKRDLKLEMTPQEVISTDRHIGLRDPDR